MAKKNIVITGASDGIGKAAAEGLDRQNYKVFVVGHNPDKTANVANKIGAKYFTVDFTDLNNVRELAKQIKKALGKKPLNVLANNAGGIYSKTINTVDGFEKTFQVNYLAPFLLTNLLLSKLLAGKGAVINTSSIGARFFGHIDIEDLNNKKHFKSTKAYGDAKLEDILMVKELHRRYHKQGLSAVAFHPGNIATNFANDHSLGMRLIYHTFLNHFLANSQVGGDNLRWFIKGIPNVDWISGRYYDERKLTNKVNPQTNNLNLQKWLWDTSLKLVGLNK